MPTIVITRPQEQATTWIDTFEAQGMTVINFPLLNISAVEDLSAIQQAWSEINNYDWVMFVSPNAVRFFFEQQGTHHWPDQLRVGSPGEGTTQALIKAGVPKDLIDQPNPEQEKDTDNLWGNIQHRAWQQQRVLLVRGAGKHPPRDWLIHQLESAGATVYPIAAYHRAVRTLTTEEKTWINTQQAQQAFWLISSSEALNAIAEFDWHQATAIVIHPRIADSAQRLGFGRIITTQPDLNSLLDSVRLTHE